MKYHIEKNTVQETLIIPLYGRKVRGYIMIRRVEGGINGE